jgi:cation diffusion facilitator CzcD-associated flavoprotein CzcO
MGSRLIPDRLSAVPARYPQEDDEMSVPHDERMTGSFDAAIVGAGFAGLYMLHRLRGLGLSARVYEAGRGVGGTWFWNRYPGARCDVESMDYSYSFSDELQQEWKWTERYASQPEILTYINHVADRFDLRRDIQLETRVTAARFDEATNRWAIQTDRDDRVSARFCIMATGCLSDAQVPKLEGFETFEGAWFHTGHWPHEGVDFTGRRVGVIGTGSSAIQSIPLIARQAAHLFVFQRTPNFSIPARNAPLDPEYERRVKSSYAEFRRQARESRVGFVVERNDQSALEVSPEERQRAFESRWSRGGLGFNATFADLLTSKDPTTRPPSSSAPRSRPSSATRRWPSCCRRGTIPSAPSGCASTPTTTTRSTGTTSPSSISAATLLPKSPRRVSGPRPRTTNST